MHPTQFVKSLSTLIKQLTILPPHNPVRYETTDGLDDPACTNGWRVAQAMEALGAFQSENNCGEDDACATADLICNLLHYAHSNGHDLSEVLVSALRNFLAEAGILKNEILSS